MTGQRGKVLHMAYERASGGDWRVIHPNYSELRDARIAAQYAESKGHEAVAASYLSVASTGWWTMTTNQDAGPATIQVRPGQVRMWRPRYQIGDLGLADIARMTQEQLAEVPSQVICELQYNLLENTLGNAYELGLVPDEEVPFLLAIGTFLEEEYTRYSL